MHKHSFILAVGLMAAAAGAQAAEFYVVVPVKARVSPESVSLALDGRSFQPARVGDVLDVNFRDLLHVTGDTAGGVVGARWSVSQGRLPSGLTLDGSSGRLAGTLSEPTPAEGVHFAVTVTYKAKMAQQQYVMVVSDEPGSCQEVLTRQPSAASGWYMLDVDGAGPVLPRSYYCDQASDGGGWTRVVRQSEGAPVSNWNGGVNGASYALAASEIPRHTQVGFGQDEVATYVDYAVGTYSAGDIAVTSMTSPKTGRTYQMHRDSVGHYSDHNPESTYASATSSFRGTLTFDQTGGSAHTWAFSPNVSNVGSRGYSLAGGRYATVDAFAWSVWVR